MSKEKSKLRFSSLKIICVGPQTQSVVREITKVTRRPFWRDPAAQATPAPTTPKSSE